MVEDSRVQGSGFRAGDSGFLALSPKLEAPFVQSSGF